MIISHRYKFIFIKTNKTAGTSIEIALSKFCDSDDIITPISLEDEIIRSHLGYLGPQNFLSPCNSSTLFYNHISAKEVKALLTKDVWDGYYKFCFERNPWDRVISLYYWLNKFEPRLPIAEFVKSKKIQRLKKKGYELYTIDGKVVVDTISKYENIAEELELFRRKVGIPERLKLPRAKSHYRKDGRGYRDILNEQSRAKIEKLFCEEIRLLGYKW